MTSRQFKNLRKKMKLTQAQLAQNLGVSVPTVNRYENLPTYKRLPPIVTMALWWLDENR